MSAPGSTRGGGPRRIGAPQRKAGCWRGEEQRAPGRPPTLAVSSGQLVKQAVAMGKRRALIGAYPGAVLEGPAVLSAGPSFSPDVRAGGGMYRPRVARATRYVRSVRGPWFLSCCSGWTITSPPRHPRRTAKAGRRTKKSKRTTARRHRTGAHQAIHSSPSLAAHKRHHPSQPPPPVPLSLGIHEPSEQRRKHRRQIDLVTRTRTTDQRPQRPRAPSSHTTSSDRKRRLSNPPQLARSLPQLTVLGDRPPLRSG